MNPGNNRPVGTTNVAAQPNRSAAAALAKAQILLENTCPKCGINHNLEPIFVEGWEDTGLTLRGKQTWTIRSVDVPGYCHECSRSLWKRRLAATALMAVPIWVCAMMNVINRGNTGWVILGLVYFLFIFRRIGYCWADWLLFGMELEMNLATRIAPVRVGDSSVRFPLGFLWSSARIAAILATTFMIMWFAETFSGSIVAPMPVTEVSERAFERQPTSIEEILKTGDVSGAKAFLLKNPARIRESNQKGETLLHFETVLKKPELVKFLLEHGAAPNACDKSPGSTPLHRAVLYDAPEAAQILLKAGANLNAQRPADRITPLQLAAVADKPETMRVLLEAGADPRLPMPGGLSLLDAARKSKCRKVIPLLEKAIKAP